MRLAYRAQPPAALFTYALHVFHDRAILQLAPAECPKATEVNREQEKGREPKSPPQGLSV
jgi:hypothetical protein